MFEISAAVGDDLPFILEIEHEAFSPPWTHSSILSEIRNDDSFFAVLRKAAESELLGFAVLRRIVDSGELLQIASAGHARRKGVGGALLSAVLENAKQCGLVSVFLEVRSSNDAAISFYLKHGFRPIRQRKDYYVEPVEDAVEMMLMINGAFQ